MATVTNSTSFTTWPPEAIEGGTITTRTGTNMTYVSDAGYTVTLRGSGFTYDDDGMGSGGTITRVIISKDGLTYADYSGVSANLTRAGLLLFGYDRGNGNQQDPQGYDFIQTLLRSNDLITGSAGRDDLRGGLGNDTINAGAGYDHVTADFGADSLDGGADGDTLSFDEANNSVDAYQGVNMDAVTGIAVDSWGFTDHFANFERYTDTLFSDTLKGSDLDEGFSLGRGVDLVDGRGGFDTVDYSDAQNHGATRGVRVNLGTGIAIDSWKNADTLISIEGVVGTSFNDTLTGSARDEEFQGGAGVDAVNGGGGYDRLAFWDVGNNGTGHGVTVNLNVTKNVVDDGYGNAETALGIEFFVGTQFGDAMTGNAANNHFGGNHGDDTLTGGGGDDDLHGDYGRDVVIGGRGNDQVGGGADDDTLTGNAGADLFNFFEPIDRAGVDTITDFAAGVDEIRIGGWGGGFVGQDLVAGQFRSGAGVTSATTAAQRFVYDTTSGDLYFDRDGAGGSDAVLFARLDNQATLTFHDFGIAF